MSITYYKLEIKQLFETPLKYRTQTEWLIENDRIKEVQLLVINKSFQPLVETDNEFRLSSDFQCSYKITDLLFSTITEYTKLPVPLINFILEFMNPKELVNKQFLFPLSLPNLRTTMIYDKSLEQHIQDEIESKILSKFRLYELNTTHGNLQELVIIGIHFTLRGSVITDFNKYNISTTNEAIPDKLGNLNAKIVLSLISFTIICQGQSRRLYTYDFEKINTYSEYIQDGNSFMIKSNISEKFNAILLGGTRLVTLGRLLSSSSSSYGRDWHYDKDYNNDYS